MAWAGFFCSACCQGSSERQLGQCLGPPCGWTGSLCGCAPGHSPVSRWPGRGAGVSVSPCSPRSPGSAAAPGHVVLSRFFPRGRDLCPPASSVPASPRPAPPLLPALLVVWLGFVSSEEPRPCPLGHLLPLWVPLMDSVTRTGPSGCPSSCPFCLQVVTRALRTRSQGPDEGPGGCVGGRASATCPPRGSASP